MEKGSISKISYQKPFSYLIFLNTFTHWYRFLKHSQYWTKNQIEQYQTKRLKDLLSHAYSNVPYYRKLFHDNNIKPNYIIKISDITQIPFITRNEIQQNDITLKAKNYPPNAFKKTMTGGTTGSPLELYVEQARWLGIHFAFNKIYMERADYHWTDKVVSLAGISKRSIYHPILRTLEISSFHTAKNDFDGYYEKIKVFKPKYIISYPSALIFFTQHLNNTGKFLPVPLKAIFLHGETVFDWQRKFLEDIYDCPVFDQYGHREQCVFATTCEQNNQFHVYHEYGLVEIIDTQGNPLTKKGKQGEIVATSFTNNVFPLIRYKTGDIAVVSDEICECGRQQILLDQILGRTQEFLIKRNNERMSATGLYNVIAEHAYHVKECQLIQEHKGDITINIVRNEGFTEYDAKQIINALSDRFKDSFSIELQYVPSIERTQQGKYRYVIQKIPKKPLKKRIKFEPKNTMNT